MESERATGTSALYPSDLLALPELQTLQDSFACATGLHVSFGTPVGQPLTDPAPLPPLCKLLRRSACRAPESLCAFAGGPQQRQLAESSGAVFASCPFSALQVAAIPLRAGGDYLGMVTCGRVLPAAPASERSSSRPRSLRVGAGQLHDALQETRVVEEQVFRAQVAHVEAVVQTVVRLAEARLAGRRASQALQVTNRRLGALGAIAAAIIRSPALEEALGEALQTILDVLLLDGGAIFLRREDSVTPRLVAHHGVKPEFAALAGGVFVSGPTPGALFQDSLDPWVVPDVTQEADLSPSLLQRLEIGAFVAVPLRAAEDVVGTLTVHTAQARDFPSDEIALMVAAGEQLGIGVQGLRLLSAEKRRAGELAILNEVAVAAGQSLELQTIVGEALDAVLRLFRTSAGLVYLLDDDSGVPTLVAQRGISNASVRHWAAKPSLGWSEEQGVDPEAHWGDASPACRQPELVRAEGFVSYASAPLRGQRQVGGLLIIFTREPRAFLPNEIELLQAVAHEVGLALENARLYRETQRRLADLEALQEFNERILHTMQEGIFITNTAGKVSYATPRLAELSGYSLEELIGSDWSTFLPTPDRDALQPSLGMLQNGHSTRAEVDLLRKDGEARHVSVGAVPLFDGGRFSGLLGVVTDLTEEMLLRRRLQQAEKLSAIGELVSGVAHELNNPLTVIRGYAQLLRASEQPGSEGRELQAITEHAERAARIVQGLLTFARERSPADEPVDLNAVLESVLDMRERQMLTSGIRIVRELDPDLPRLRGDPYQLQQVFLNILINAEQALAEKGMGGEVVARTMLLPEGSVLATIRDNGPGIPAAIAGRIFDPFFTTKADRQGTGLGLSISYGIVHAHRGRIWAESEEGHGATFHVTLPLPAPKAAEPPRPAVASLAEAVAEGNHVLVLEDEAEIAELEARCLEALGCQATIATEAQAALELIEREEFDLVLTDLKMPGMSGREFFARLGSAKPHMVERVIFVTGDTVNPDTQRFLSQSGRPHLAKPFSLDEMHNVVLAALEEGTTSATEE